jgi:hypothetical protein
MKELLHIVTALILRRANEQKSLKDSSANHLAEDVSSGRRYFPLQQKEKDVVRLGGETSVLRSGGEGEKYSEERAMRVPDGPVYHIRDTLKQ